MSWSPDYVVLCVLLVSPKCLGGKCLGGRFLNRVNSSALTSTWMVRYAISSNKVFHNLICYEFTYGCVLTMLLTLSLTLTKLLGFYWESWTMMGNKPQHYVVVEALDSFKKGPTPTSIPNIWKVVDNFYMLWMCLWMWPYHVTASLIGQASQMVLLQIPGNPGHQTTALCSGWGSGLIHYDTHFSVKHM